MSLKDKKCKPCEGGIPPLNKEGVTSYLKELSSDWKVVSDGEKGDRYGSNRKLKKAFKFDDFESAVKFVNKIAGLAEEEGHHPNIHIYYDKVVLELTTHAIGGLSENDFILASKVDDLT